jgi:hypothetical protein
MTKRLHFNPDLVALILNGKKTSTWRLWDDKDLKTGDIVEFADSVTREVFATAKLTRVIEKPFMDLSEEEKLGHEKYSDPEELFKKFSVYYGKRVDSLTLFKVIKFELY